MPSVEPSPRAASPALPAPPPGDPRCRLFQTGADTAAADDCLACHQVGRGVPVMQGSHPVDLDYADAQAGSPDGLRAPAEVIRRGVLLPNGKVQCVTCHDGASPWASRIALPPGTIPRAAVDPGDPRTHARPRSWRLADPDAPRLEAGAAVTPSPLCAACHTLAD